MNSSARSRQKQSFEKYKKYKLHSRRRQRPPCGQREAAVARMGWTRRTRMELRRSSPYDQVHQGWRRYGGKKHNVNRQVEKIWMQGRSWT